jgi:hypothetical protein
MDIIYYLDLCIKLLLCYAIVWFSCSDSLSIPSLRSSFPKMYYTGRLNSLLRLPVVGTTIASGLIASAAAYYIPKMFLPSALGAHGKGTTEIYGMTMPCFSAVIFINSLVIVFLSDSVNGPLVTTVVFSVWMFGSWFIACGFNLVEETFAVNWELLNTPLFHLIVSLIMATVVAPIFLSFQLYRNFRKSLRALWLRSKAEAESKVEASEPNDTEAGTSLLSKTNEEDLEAHLPEIGDDELVLSDRNMY